MLGPMCNVESMHCEVRGELANVLENALLVEPLHIVPVVHLKPAETVLRFGLPYTCHLPTVYRTTIWKLLLTMPCRTG